MLQVDIYLNFLNSNFQEPVCITVYLNQHKTEPLKD